MELSSLIIIIVAGFRGEDCVPGGRHGDVAFDVAPEDAIQKRGVDGIGTGEIHFGGLRCAGSFAGMSHERPNAATSEANIEPAMPSQVFFGLMCGTN